MLTGDLTAELRVTDPPHGGRPVILIQSAREGDGDVGDSWELARYCLGIVRDASVGGLCRACGDQVARLVGNVGQWIGMDRTPGLGVRCDAWCIGARVGAFPRPGGLADPIAA